MDVGSDSVLCWNYSIRGRLQIIRAISLSGISYAILPVFVLDSFCMRLVFLHRRVFSYRVIGIGSRHHPKSVLA